MESPKNDKPRGKKPWKGFRVVGSPYWVIENAVTPCLVQAEAAYWTKLRSKSLRYIG